MLTRTNCALSSLSNETAQQKNKAVAKESFMIGVNQSHEVGAYIDTFEFDNLYIKSMGVTGSGIKLVSPLRSG